MSTSIQQDADARVRVVAPMSNEVDVGTRVVGALDRRSDCGQWITRPVQVEGDLAAHIHRSVGNEARKAVTRQIIFAVLIRESHPIET